VNTPHSDQLTGHEYDGIKEYDNPTPGWWHLLFAFSVVFSVCYAVFWHMSVAGWSVQDSWESDQRAEFKRVFGAVGQMTPDEATLLREMNNSKFMAIAKATFIGNCTACHARDGGGGVGVNLCDDAYKSVTRIEDIYRILTEGAAGGAMPAWKNRLSDNERVIVAAYVASLRGTSPANPKGPEGTVIPPWPKAPAPSDPPPAK